MQDSLLVGTDATDSEPRPVSFALAHERGLPHRAVHIEIENTSGEYLVQQRRDGRQEVLGGHVDWLADRQRPECYDEAALREMREELCLSHLWRLSPQESDERLKSRLIPVVRFINQLPSSQRNNNEWVTAFHVAWPDGWGDLSAYPLSEEQGRKRPEWMPLSEIIRMSLERPWAINAALRHFLARRGVMAPLVPEDCRGI